MDVNVDKGNAMRVRAVLPWIAACSLVACPVPALADDCATGSVAQQMACLRMSNAVLSERLTQATLRKNLNKESSSGGVNSRKLGLPLVMSTYGVGDKMTAVLVYMHHGKSDGTLIVHSGSRLPGGWVVRGMVGGTVALQKGDQVKTLLLNAGSSGHSMSLSSVASNAGFNLSQMGGTPPMTSSSGAVSGMAGVR